ncbi:MAG: phage tail protein [Beijerinckiaceae bacterium]
MGLLRQNSNPASIPKYTGLQIQTSSSSVPIAIIWGANKTAPNVIWTGGFTSVQQDQSESGGGYGKGGGGGVQGYNYFTGFIMGVCEGPIVVPGVIWLNNSVNYFDQVGIDFAAYGATPQTPWGYLSSYGKQSLGYNGLFYFAASHFALGSSPSLPQFSIEVRGPLHASAGINANDADPALIIQEFLTNAQYGVLFPAASIDATTLLASPVSSTVTITIASPAVITWTAHGLSNGQAVRFTTTGALPTGLAAATVYFVLAATTNTFQVSATPGGAAINTSGSQSGVHTAATVGSSYQAYCKASFLGLSPVLSNQEAANSILARWLNLTNSAAVWSGGKLKFIPYGDSPVTGNLYPSGTYSFAPNVTPIYNLSDDDFIHEDGKDPLEVVRSDPYASYNWQRLQISQRYNSAGTSYDSKPIDVFDQNAIELYGLRRAPDITANEICDPFVGQKSAQLILQRGLYIRSTYNFKLSFEYCLLEPMDIVTVTDASLGLTNVAIRIVSIEEDDAGILSVTAEEFPSGIATAVQYPVQRGDGTLVNQAVVPARVNVPILYEPPASLTGGVAQVFAAVSGGIAQVYLLAETAVTGGHRTHQLVPSQPNGTVVTFSVYAQAVTRGAVRLDLSNGSVTIGCDFDLAAGATGTPDTGISTASIAVAGGGDSAPVTITIASPAVVTWTAHGLSNGQAVVFSTTGALPTGLTAGTVYYVVAATTNTFQVAAAAGGAAINTSGSQSGIHTGTTGIWYQCLITGSMAATAVPDLIIRLQNPLGTNSYAGTSGNGVNIWGAEVAFGGEAPTFLPAFQLTTNATLSTTAALTPKGSPGIADPNWGGAFVWISTNGATYGQIGTVAAPARQGVLTAALAAPPGSNPDNTNTLSVSLIESGGTLAGGTALDAQNGVTLCLVDNELLSYQTAALTGTNAYNLTTLYRGLHGTKPAAHSNGAPFARIDGAIFKYTLPSAYIGVPLFLKFQSFNIFGRSVEDLSVCTVYTYTPSGAGSPAGPVTQALLLGTNLDFGLVSAAVSQIDQWGIVTDGVLMASVDLGAGIP